MELKKIEADRVSINVALDMARNAYIKGCLYAYHEQGKKGIYQKCNDKSLEFIKEIESIITQ